MLIAVTLLRRCTTNTAGGETSAATNAAPAIVKVSGCPMNRRVLSPQRLAPTSLCLSGC